MVTFVLFLIDCLCVCMNRIVFPVGFILSYRILMYFLLVKFW